MLTNSNGSIFTYEYCCAFAYKLLHTVGQFIVVTIT